MHVALDNHDIISMKLYQLTVERTPEEEKEEEEEVTIPSVDNMQQYQGRFEHGPVSSSFSEDWMILESYRHVDSILIL